jgi:hypothetical protein
MDNQEILATLITKDNQEWTIRRYWQRKEQRAIKNGQTGDTGNIRNKGPSRMDNQEYTGNFRSILDCPLLLTLPVSPDCPFLIALYS